jgi:hypothetical protein
LSIFHREGKMGAKSNGLRYWDLAPFPALPIAQNLRGVFDD